MGPHGSPFKTMAEQPQRQTQKTKQDKKEHSPPPPLVFRIEKGCWKGILYHSWRTTETWLSQEPYSTNYVHSIGLKYMGIPGINQLGSLNQAAWSLQWTIYYTVKQHLETMLYKPLCHHGLRSLHQDLSTLLWHVAQHMCIVYRVHGGA